MAEIVGCPKCGRKLAIPEEFAGRDVQCPSCNTQFRATTSAVAAQPVASPERGEEYDRGGRGGRYEGDVDIRRRDMMPHRGGTILALGIIGFFCFGIILGPIAWAMGAGDLRKMREGQMDPSGEGTTRAGMICGIIVTVLAAFGVVYMIVMLSTMR